MNKLDLHTHRHATVPNLVEDWVLMNQTDIPLTIICGNSNKMIELVVAVLDKLDIEHRMWQYGVIVIDRI
jgi:hypothetical protein|tara:strand:- start:751 stop:960 length:210 start_codon:yes stop_codon:yes gene_type:complete